MRHPPTSRSVRGAPVTIVWQPTDADGEPIAAPGPITVEALRHDGTVLKPAGTVASDGLALTATECASLDLLTLNWVSVDSTATTTHEVTGGVYVSLATAKTLEPSLVGKADTEVRRARDVVEQLVESDGGAARAFVPRFTAETHHVCHARRVVLDQPDVRAVRGVLLDGDPVTDTVLYGGPGVLEFDACLTGELSVAYEYGWDRPPADLAHQVVTAMRNVINEFARALPDRAMSYQPVDGGNVVLATAGLGPWITALPSVDEAIRRYRFEKIGVG